MKTISISDLKAHLSKQMQLVQQGQSVLLVERGRPVAQIKPLSPAASEEEWEAILLQTGLVRTAQAALPATFFQSPFALPRK